ncbi:MAG: transposase zinc-binding domain-containing protein [Pirellulaceae bacterium]
MSPEIPSGCLMPHPGDGGGPTVREVLQRHAPGVIRAFPPRTSFDKLYVLRQLTECRTGLHGSHAWHCRWCGHSQISHNGCNNRHCASCGQRKRLEWVDRILGWSLPIDYLHCVVTLPHEFIPLILANDNAMYRLFFECVGRTLRELALEKHGAQVGVVMVLHSWGQRMNRHPISTRS